jgi:hypothetical protein
MENRSNSQSGQTLVEYGILVALVVFLTCTTLLIPSALIYLFMRHVAHADRRSAILAALGFTALMAIINGGAMAKEHLDQHNGCCGNGQNNNCCDGCAGTSCNCGEDCNCSEDCGCSEGCDCGDCPDCCPDDRSDSEKEDSSAEAPANA